MGWIAVRKNPPVLVLENNEDGTTNGRPVDAGNNNELMGIGVEAYGHKAYIDLTNGVIVLDFSEIGLQNGTVEIHNPGHIISICDETNIVGEFQKQKRTKPDKDGNVFMTYEPLFWKPIWFKRHISTLPAPVEVVGAETRLPGKGGKKIKKMVSLYPDGRLGIS